MKENPPNGIEYNFISPQDEPTLQGALKYYASEYDLIESSDAPCLTKDNWIYYCSQPQCCYTFHFFGQGGFSLNTKKEIINRILSKDNFKKLVFNSNWAKMSTIRNFSMPNQILDKSTIAHYAISKIEDISNPNSEEINITLVGASFFRKGGINVLDAFEILQKKYDNLKLTLASEFFLPETDVDKQFTQHYSKKIKQNKGISMDYFTKKELYGQVYPSSNIFVLPSLSEGGYPFSLIEAQAFGLPIISSDISAIPEIVADNKNGFIIKKPKLIKRNCFSKKYNQYTTKKMYEYLERLILDKKLRIKMSRESLKRANTLFSFETKNKKFKQVYESI